MVVIASTIKHSITPHISSFKASHCAWEVLQTMYQSKNEARIQFLKKQLDKLEMQEGDSIVDHFTKIQDLQEQLLNIDEVIPIIDMMSKTRISLLASYLNFHPSIYACKPSTSSF